MNTKSRLPTLGLYAFLILLTMAGIAASQLSNDSSHEEVVWSTYDNHEFEFTVIHPKTWKIEEHRKNIARNGISQQSSNATTKYFSASFLSNDGASFNVMPRGFDPRIRYSLPDEEPIEKSAIIAGRKATLAETISKDGLTYIFVSFKSYPTTWFQSHKIMIITNTKNRKTLGQMLASFKFKDSSRNE